MRQTGAEGHVQQIVSAIVLTYVNWEETLKCVADLRAQDYDNLDIVIVDNASPNDCYARLKQSTAGMPRVAVIRTQANDGYASGNNAGMRWRLRQGPVSYFLIANNDVRISNPSVVSLLVDFAGSRQDAGIVGPRVLSTSGFPQGPYARPNILLYTCRYLAPILPYLFRLFRRVTREYADPRPCYANVGAFFLVEAKAMQQAELFDEATFLGAEEYILSERLRVSGYGNYYFPAISVLHNHDASAIRRTGGEARYFSGGLASMRYYFARYQGCSRFALLAFTVSARCYERLFLPLRRYTGL